MKEEIWNKVVELTKNPYNIGANIAYIDTYENGSVVAVFKLLYSIQRNDVIDALINVGVKKNDINFDIESLTFKYRFVIKVYKD